MNNNKYSKYHICKQCGRKFWGTGTLCNKHRSQINIYGKCIDSNPRSKQDPNEIIYHKDYAEVITYDDFSNPKYKFKIDIEDVPIIIQFKWFATISNKQHRNLIYLNNNKIGLYHRFILGARKWQTVDHINQDPFDNRKCNLRIATQTEQNLNTHNRVETKFDIKGIDRHRDINRRKRFMARLNYNNKCYRSAWYETYEEAVFARYLLEQLCPYLISNGNMSQYISKLTEDQKKPIIKWFTNRFKDRV